MASPEGDYLNYFTILVYLKSGLIREVSFDGSEGTTVVYVHEHRLDLFYFSVSYIIKKSHNICIYIVNYSYLFLFIYMYHHGYYTFYNVHVRLKSLMKKCSLFSLYSYKC